MSSQEEGRPAPLVLIVDDEELIRTLGRKALELSGIEVVEASDGVEAVQKFEQRRPDLVLLDVRLPGQNGFSTCRRIRELPSGRFTPILMVTGFEDESSVKRAFEAGATDFETKPINWLLLQHRIQYMLKSSYYARELRQSREKLERAQRIAHLGYWEWQPAEDLLACSNELNQILGGTPKSMEKLIQRIYPEDRQQVEQSIDQTLNYGRPRLVDYRVVRPSGELRYVQQQILSLDNETERARRIGGIVQDVTERRNAEEKVQFLAYYDGLTGLPNRRSFTEHLKTALSQAERDDSKVAVLLLDIDRFKRVTESLGYSSGDEILRACAERLGSCLLEADTSSRPGIEGRRQHGLVSRFGGDEFVILLTEITRISDAAAMAKKLRQTLETPFDIQGNPVFLTGSIGIAVYREDGQEVDSLLRSASLACAYASKRGGGDIQFYSDSMNAEASQSLLVESSLRDALEKNEFLLHYQPVFCADSGQITGAEALLRWDRNGTGILTPDAFISEAEESGLIVPIGSWVLHEACSQAHRWQEAASHPFRISVNLSSMQFAQGDLEETVRAALCASKLSPALLDLEITERTLMQDCGKTLATLESLATLGPRFLIDDFGTGYSSLAYLTRFPVSKLKIDRGFMTGLPHHKKNVGITRAILSLAKSLDMGVIAEGVETEEQLSFLRHEGCAQVQGFYLGRPVDPAEFQCFFEIDPASPATGIRAPESDNPPALSY